mmetsp:Transcript_28488/g.55577  ORF Transcript_28488/g.55577 Transcript_28488/m.55577 type:complete len:201 (+) Transcript_28488:240-842(+)|eukprot:CAMPEP_0173380932 /NCGR_PEP_ID=MMETSP1356-20130122/3480_1 /TAXON_ID=77927 ORGANISM="Hemiselmis virescens, Strain PCC157" /NCGR_SAMPLE_ID=MMETSP1356 /ASSEMBLY_ACC=CAM_ASM_000847 /LENGTH=200 /DNA_ID=CAMNT_0014334655 /DNA_START=235 /DNA_END=837 /DNA_ORIENTATION=-
MPWPLLLLVPLLLLLAVRLLPLTPAEDTFTFAPGEALAFGFDEALGLGFDGALALGFDKALAFGSGEALTLGFDEALALGFDKALAFGLGARAEGLAVNARAAGLVMPFDLPFGVAFLVSFCEALDVVGDATLVVAFEVVCAAVGFEAFDAAFEGGFLAAFFLLAPTSSPSSSRGLFVELPALEEDGLSDTFEAPKSFRS